MAKKTTKSTKAGFGGGVNRDEQVRALANRIGADGCAKAQQIIKDFGPDVIRYAYRSLPRRWVRGGLSKREIAHYEKIKAAKGEAVAQQWKELTLLSKSA